MPSIFPRAGIYISGCEVHRRGSAWKIQLELEEIVKFFTQGNLFTPDDEIPNLEFAVKGFIQWPIGAIARFTGSSKTPVSRVLIKRVMPQHQNEPSTKQGKGNETLKEPNKQDKDNAPEETTQNKKALQRIAEVAKLKERVPWSDKRPLENKELNAIIGLSEVVQKYCKSVHKLEYEANPHVSKKDAKENTARDPMRIWKLHDTELLVRFLAVRHESRSTTLHTATRKGCVKTQDKRTSSSQLTRSLWFASTDLCSKEVEMVVLEDSFV
ncbi:hypothetical protein Tco_0490673 [Tanacetum coccineum]